MGLKKNFLNTKITSKILNILFVFSDLKNSLSFLI